MTAMRSHLTWTWPRLAPSPSLRLWARDAAAGAALVVFFGCLFVLL